MGLNVMSCVLVSGTKRHPLVGAYIPPADVSTLEFIELALNRFSTGPAPILLGDLNVNLRAPQGARENQIAALVASYGLFDLLPNFKQRWRYGDGATWSQHRDGEVVKGWCDYILGTDRRMFSNVCLRDPQCFSSDHYMVKGLLLSAPLHRNRRYLNGRQRYPLKAPKVGPDSPLADQLFQRLKDACPTPAPRGRKRVQWISANTWALVDQRSALRRTPNFTQARLRALNRRVKASLKEDRRRRVEEAGQAIEAALGHHDAKGAWTRAKAWYRQAEDRPPKPSRQELGQVTSEWTNLYTAIPPPGDPIEVMVSPFDIPDGTPTEDEIADAVGRLKRGKAPGPTGIRSDHLKDWLAAARREETPDSTNWDTLVELVQHVFDTGNLPEDMAWSTMVLLPKGGGGGFGVSDSWILCGNFWRRS